MLPIERTREPSPADRETVKALFYAIPVIDRAKPVLAELTWVLLGRQHADQHEKILPDYCYNIFDVVQKTIFKAFPSVSETILVTDQAGLETAKTIEDAKKVIRLDWRNLGRLMGLALRCFRFSELEAQSQLKEDGFDEMTPEKTKELFTVIFGRAWVEENQASLMAQTPDAYFATMLKQFMAAWIEKIQAIQPKLDAWAYQWSPAAMVEYNEGMAEGMKAFLTLEGQLAGESRRSGIYFFLILVWPEIKEMLEASPRKTVTDLQEWMLPFMRMGITTYIEIDTLRSVCAPPSQSGIGLSLRPLISRLPDSSA